MSDREFDLQDVWQRVWMRRRSVVTMAIVAAALGAAVAFLLPTWYRSESVLMPPTESESGFGLASLLRGISVPGISLPTTSTPADVFVAILQSRRLSESIVKEFDLQNRYRVKFLDDALKELATHTKFKLTQSGTIVITVEDRDPKQAAAIANRYVTLLDQFNREVRMTKGRRTRMFIESRIAETRDQLTAAEHALTSYQSQHKTPPVNPEKASGGAGVADLYAQRVALQVRLGVVRSYTRASTDEEVQIQEKLRQIDQQLANLPQVGLEQTRLVRDVTTLEQIYILLSAQFEQAKIDEARDIATVEVLDTAPVPSRKARPHRSIIILGSFLFGAAMGIAAALSRGTGVPAAAADPRAA